MSGRLLLVRRSVRPIYLQSIASSCFTMHTLLTWLQEAADMLRISGFSAAASTAHTEAAINATGMLRSRLEEVGKRIGFGSASRRAARVRPHAAHRRCRLALRLRSGGRTAERLAARWILLHPCRVLLLLPRAAAEAAERVLCMRVASKAVAQ